MKRLLASLAVVSLGLAAVAPARAGHELSFYPSFYPQEIRVETLTPAAAAPRLVAGSLHAYVGADPFAGGPAPTNVAATESFGSYLVLTWPEGTTVARAERCATASALAGALARARAGVVAYPYAITPFHADYLEHADLAAAARAAETPVAVPAVTIDAPPALTKPLAAHGWHVGHAGAAATLEAVPLTTLLAGAERSLDGRLGPPWLKAGWFHAWLLQAAALRDAASRRRAQGLYRQLTTGAYPDLAARLNLERDLVRTLASGCERAVVGYTVRREYTSDDYSNGVENVGADAFAGLASDIFVRTVKLKDFPWNGWLRVGTPAPPAAAWNPIGGFTDGAGRLIWAALGDPALLPAPRSADWLPDRVTPSDATTAGVDIPAVALVPRPGGLAPVGKGQRAAARVVYRVRASAFHDGSRMAAADVLYGLVFAARWSARPGATDYDADVDRATAMQRDWLRAVRVVRVEKETRKFSDVEFVYQVPIVEMYLAHTLADPAQLAAVVPPWTSVPWHLAALMEEAVREGVGAFSAAEAHRRGVPWLDLARDRGTKEKLTAIVERYREQAFVPPALRGLVTADEARERWTALERFAKAHHHFLVTNGPYRLERWSPDGAVLEVFRDLTYPLGVGFFDEYAIPLRAHVQKVEQHGRRLALTVEAEEASHYGRTYEIARAPLPEDPQPMEIDHLPVCRYVVLDSGGRVLRAGTGRFGAGQIEIDPGRGLADPADVLLALYQEHNAVAVEVRSLPRRLLSP